MNNKVILLGHYGSDKSHALSAWTSTFDEEGIDLPKDTKKRIDVLFEQVRNNRKSKYELLLKYLAEHEHHTPFEKSFLHFQVVSDIATHIHLIKHRIGVSVNTESARYKELEDKYLIPEDIPDLMKADIKLHTDAGNSLYHVWKKELVEKHGFTQSRAKEVSRYFLGYNKQLVQDVSFNFRSFYHFQKLRNSEHAQKEVREIAQSMLQQVKELEGNPFEMTIKAFNL